MATASRDNLRRAPLGLALAAAALHLLGPAPAPAQLAEHLGTAFEQAIVGAAGTEAQGTHEFDYLGMHLRLDVLAVVFCQPPDPMAPPDPAPVPPLTAYGCVASQTAVAAVPPGGETARITLYLDVIYADITTQRTMGLLCGELTVGTVTGDGYLLTSGTLTSDYTLARVGSCVQATLVPGSVALTLGEVTADVEDGCIADYWGALSDQLVPDLQAGLQQGLATLIASRMDALNQQLCTLTPVDASTWGRVKGLYGRPGGGGE